MNIILSVFFIALSCLATQMFCRLAKNTRLMDKPNERSLHVTPTVRGGGLVFIGLFLFSIPVVGYYYHISVMDQCLLFVGTLLIAMISFGDDLFHLSAKARFVVQCVVAGLIACLARPEALDFVVFSLTNSFLIIGLIFFVVIGSINHFNFMDGLDGFCGSQALFLFFSYALLFGFNNALFYQDLSWILVFGLIGFLMFNFPPAKLFMGDVGSATLGFISFYFALVAQQKYQIPILYWFILNGLFLFDSSITLVRRIHKKENWFAPHRKHAYQRLKQYGLNTRLILLGQACINSLLFCGVLLIQRQAIDPNILFALCLGVFILMYSLVEKVYPMFKEE